MFLRASIIIPVYNRLNLLKISLEALYNQTVGDFEVIVIDDGSTDQTVEYLTLQAAQWKRLRWERHANNQGRSRARNTGIQMARAPLLIFLDSDVIVLPDFVKAHLQFHNQQGSNWIGQGPIILTHNPDHPTETPVSLWTDASQAFFATGNVSVTRKAVLKVGGFDTDFQQYGWEDLELGIRLRQSGLKTGRVSQAPGFHLEPHFNLSQWQELRQKEQARAQGAWLFFQKHPCLEVRFITQLTPMHRLLDQIIQFMLLSGRSPENYLAQLQKQSSEKKQLAISRILLNHDYLVALQQIQKRSLKRVSGKAGRERV